jgi:hypothetical protein
MPGICRRSVGDDAAAFHFKNASLAVRGLTLRLIWENAVVQPRSATKVSNLRSRAWLWSILAMYVRHLVFFDEHLTLGIDFSKSKTANFIDQKWVVGGHNLDVVVCKSME